MRLYFIALQFLTIIPLPFQLRCDERDLGRSMAFFPLAGLTLGGVLAGADFLLVQVFPRPVADLLLVAFLALLTGALHLDGLADVCDGLAARGGRERFLAVMKDSRVGAVGVVGLVLGLLLKYQALLQVPLAEKRAALFLFPAVARCCQVLMTVGARSARLDGLGTAFIGGAGFVQLLAAYLVMLPAAYLLSGWRGIAIVFILSAMTWFCRWYFTRRMGGITGDVIGCASELSEIGALILILSLSTLHV